MPYPAHVSDTAYCYDGSFAGFLCCVFESYTRHEIPSAVLGPGEGQTTLFGLKTIPTDPAHAKRVADGLTRLGPMVKERVTIGFLSTEEEKDLITTDRDELRRIVERKMQNQTETEES